jgi:hypothetical protein
MKPTAEREALERALWEVVGYAVTSARTLLDETPTYGPLRLLEAARRTIDAMQVAGIESREARDLRAKIDATTASFVDGEDAFCAHLDPLVGETLWLA